MNKEKRAFQFDDLIDDFFAALETGDESKVLEDYIKDFPEFEIDLLEAAAYKRTVSEMPDHEYTKEEEESLDLRTRSIVQNILYKYRQNDPSQPQVAEEQKPDTLYEITDLYDEIKKIGFTDEDFFEKTRLSETVIDAFNSRQVRYDSIVRGAIHIMSDVLNLPVVAFENFLRKIPVLRAMHMKADKTPEFQAQMEFLKLIDTDPDLSEEDKNYWLQQPTIEDEQN